MRRFVQKQPQPQQDTLTNFTRSNTMARTANHGEIQTTPRCIYDFSRMPVHAKAPVKMQAKLAVSAPADAYEQEADRNSEQVMRMAEVSPEHLPKGSESSHSGLTAASPSVPEVLRSSGQPLDPATRAFMEPRLGHDFSRVRVHSGPAAEHSALDMNAHAYTLGQNIVFGKGRFAPTTHEGRRLIAHELTHVVQQDRQQAPPHIQRKEVNASIMDTARTPLPPQDWYSLHREDWEHASATGTERALGPSNSFMRAAWFNTLNLRPNEYQTINERHDYYDLISYVIENDPGTPQHVRGVRFFHATTAVTGSPGIGSVDKPIGALKLRADTRQILREVNAELFALNMGVVRNLLSTWKEPRDPKTPGSRINAFDFDIRMVETEQALVEDYITRNKARFTPEVVQDINDTMDPSAFGQFFNFSRHSFEWAIKALGVPTLNFTIRDHRQAIGFATVHIFHRKSEQDYLTFMKARVPRVPPRNRHTVQKLGGITLNEDLPGPVLTYDLRLGTLVEVVDWSHMMGPHQLNDIYAGKVEVLVLDGTHEGKRGWTDFDNLDESSSP